MLRRLIPGFFLLTVLAGCAASTAKDETPVTISKEDKALLDRAKAEEKAKHDALVISPEDKALLDKVKAMQQAKAVLAKDPSRFIKAGSWEVLDRGILNSYSRATAIEFTNGSDFDVADIEGKLTYVSATGGDMATVPFRAEGGLRAGETRKLKIAAGEITGASKTGKVAVENLKILGGI